MGFVSVVVVVVVDGSGHRQVVVGSVVVVGSGGMQPSASHPASRARLRPHVVPASAPVPAPKRAYSPHSELVQPPVAATHQP